MAKKTKAERTLEKDKAEAPAAVEQAQAEPAAPELPDPNPGPGESLGEQGKPQAATPAPVAGVEDVKEPLPDPNPGPKLAETDPPPAAPTSTIKIKQLLIVSDGNVFQTMRCDFNNIELMGLKAWLATQQVQAAPAQPAPEAAPAEQK